jgi:hypothetical protein
MKRFFWFSGAGGPLSAAARRRSGAAGNRFPRPLGLSLSPLPVVSLSCCAFFHQHSKHHNNTPRPPYKTTPNTNQQHGAGPPLKEQQKEGRCRKKQRQRARWTAAAASSRARYGFVRARVVTASLLAKSSSWNGRRGTRALRWVPETRTQEEGSPAGRPPHRPLDPPPRKNKNQTKQLVEALGVDPALVQKKLQANQALIGAFFEGTGPGTLRFYHQVGAAGRGFGGRAGGEERSTTKGERSFSGPWVGGWGGRGLLRFWCPVAPPFFCARLFSLSPAPFADPTPTTTKKTTQPSSRRPQPRRPLPRPLPPRPPPPRQAAAAASTTTTATTTTTPRRCYSSRPPRSPSSAPIFTTGRPGPPTRSRRQHPPPRPPPPAPPSAPARAASSSRASCRTAARSRTRRPRTI